MPQDEVQPLVRRVGLNLPGRPSTISIPVATLPEYSLLFSKVSFLPCRSYLSDYALVLILHPLCGIIYMFLFTPNYLSFI